MKKAQIIKYKCNSLNVKICVFNILNKEKDNYVIRNNNCIILQQQTIIIHL